MRIHSYVVDHDIGFAPNPYHGYCTLATCKQEIRRVAEVDDWVIGTGAAKNRRAGYLVYAMRIEEALTFDDYWRDSRFGRKRPDLSGSRKVRFGDNIYHCETGVWVQENSRHSRADGTPEPIHIERDTKSDRVLISSDFVYFGKDGPPVPSELRTRYPMDLVSLRGHRNRFPAEQVAEAEAWLRTLPRGVVGKPFDWHRKENLARTRR
ncbi:hypothetical protein [Microbacterium sp. CFBP 8794]|uniref:Nmad2 family putative nucleotide modification protein n=1 Tax=Microbacterium sp. CFBP 8794 TaxID=2775269 RepID=UPI0018FE1CC0